jgi:hypothetical protein
LNNAALVFTCFNQVVQGGSNADIRAESEVCGRTILGCIRYEAKTHTSRALESRALAQNVVERKVLPEGW